MRDTKISLDLTIKWLSLAGVVLKCQRIDQALEPISVYADLSAFKLYMGDVGLLAMKPVSPSKQFFRGKAIPSWAR
jgi:hypothetical protein